MPTRQSVMGFGQALANMMAQFKQQQEDKQIQDQFSQDPSVNPNVATGEAGSRDASGNMQFHQTQPQFDTQRIAQNLIPFLGTNRAALPAFQGISAFEPKYSFINQEGGGLQQVKQVLGQEPQFKQLAPTQSLTKPTVYEPIEIPTGKTKTEGGVFQREFTRGDPTTGKALPNATTYWKASEPSSTGGNAASDKSYQFHTAQISALAKPLQDRADRMERLQVSINQKNPQADALVAPELLTAMAGGMGSGLRMNEAEISRIVGGKNAWESLKSTLLKYQANPDKPFLIPDNQRTQIQGLIDAMSGKITEKNNAVIEAQQALADAKTPAEHRKIFADLRKKLSGSGGGTATLSSEDQQAIDWAKTHRDDPDAQKILKLHGIK